MPPFIEQILNLDIGVAGGLIWYLYRENKRFKDLLGDCRSEKDALHKRFQSYAEEQAKIWRELSTTVKETRKLKNGGQDS